MSSCYFLILAPLAVLMDFSPLSGTSGPPWTQPHSRLLAEGDSRPEYL